MVLPLRKRALPEAALAERRRTQSSVLTPRGWLLLVGTLSFGGGIFLIATAWAVAFEAGIRQADEDAVYRGVRDAVHVGVRVALRADSAEREKRVVAAQAAKQLPKRVLDSLRNARWTTPDTAKGAR